MKKQGVLALMMISLMIFSFKSKKESEIKGWFLAGSRPESYEIGLTESEDRSGKVAYLKSTKKVPHRGFGTIMQMFEPKSYLGKRVKLSGYIKSTDVKGWAGMWMRVDGVDKAALTFDNMQDRPIKGTTDWKKYEIVLDVPPESKKIAYGVLLDNTGSVLIDDFSFEIVQENYPATGRAGSIQLEEPTNTSFEEQE